MIRSAKPSCVAALLAMVTTTSVAHATVTKTIDFNDHTALSRLPYENITFATAPWYQVNLNTPAAPVVFTVQDNSTNGHYHVNYESACMCFPTSSGRFGLDMKCAGQSSTATCTDIDTTFQPRNVLPHVGPASILWSAVATQPFTGNQVPRAFTVNSVQLENNQPVIFCGNSTTPGNGVLCTGIVRGPGKVNLSGIGSVTWMEIHGTPDAAPYQFDNIVVTF